MHLPLTLLQAQTHLPAFLLHQGTQAPCVETLLNKAQSPTPEMNLMSRHAQGHL